MYARRPAVVTVRSLRPLFNIRKIGAPESIISASVFCFLRNVGTATQKYDIYNNSDVNIAENQTFGSGYNQNGSGGVRNLGGVEENPNQNLSRVYEQSQNGNCNNSITDVSNLSNTSGSDNAGNRFGYNSGDQRNQFHGRNLYANEPNRNPNRLYGQNFDVQRGNLAYSDVGSGQQNANFNVHNKLGESYGGNEDMSRQNVQNHVNYYNNDSHVPIDMNLNVAPVEECTSTSKISDLDDFIKEGKLKEAVELLGVLQNEGIQVELPRYMELIKVCGANEALDEAKSLHGHLMKSGAHLDVGIYNRILEMYSKCGSMCDAFEVFDQMPQRNMSSWDIMISWLAKNGHGEDSIDLFEEFKSCDLKPDGQMFIGVFSACGVLSDTVEGMLHFESMMKDYEIAPTMDHYVGIVDMFGTAGCLDEALEFIHNLPIEPSVDIWETLMKFCRIHGNFELGDQCADLIQLLDPSRMNEQSRAGLIPINASDIAKEKERKKLDGQNLIAVRSRVHEYRAGDRSQPGHERIYSLLRSLKQHMIEVGYVPQTKFVLHDVDIEVKEEALMAHSERLAVAQGLLASPARSSMRIIKNLRACGDCHNAFKIISKIVGREIVARDAKRFHHFRDGSCSCNDYW